MNEENPSTARAVALAAVPTAEEYAYALANNESFERRLIIRIGRLADPLYKAEAYIGVKVHEIGKWISNLPAALVDGLNFLIYGSTEVEE